MEKKLSFNLLLPLKEIALRRVAVHLWNEPDILAAIVKFPFASIIDSENKKIWRETVANTVTARMSKLVLPKSLSKQMINIIVPIGAEILRWKRFHELYLSQEINVPILELLFWTSAGTVDYKKTAEELIRSKVISIAKCYRLACLYCIEDHILVLWEQLPERFRKLFDKEQNLLLMDQPHLDFCWPYILQGEQSKLNRGHSGNQHTFQQYAFELLAFNGNKAAAEYFFQKLTHEERNTSLLKTAKDVARKRRSRKLKYYDNFPKEKNSEVLCYLLSLMTPTQQMEIFKAQPCEVLYCFLDWPWQDHFLDIAELIRTFLPQRKYFYLLNNIAKSIQNSGYCFPKFQEFFLHSPAAFRKLFVDHECTFGSFISEFFNSEDCETIEVIFRNIDPEDRVTLISCDHIFDLLYEFGLTGKWHMVEVCLREATLTEENRFKAFKKPFLEFLFKTDRGPTERTGIVWKKKDWERFSQIVKRVSGEKSSNNETQRKVKKLFCK